MPEIDVAIAGADQLEAEIHVLVVAGQQLVEPANLVEHLSPAHQAGARHRGVVVGGDDLAHVSGRGAGHAAMAVRREPAEAEDRARVLDRSILV